jgi:hypothetical protein
MLLMKYLSRRALFAAALCAPVAMLAAQEVPDDLKDQAMALERPWNLFIRKLFGCPTPVGDTTPETCSKPGTIDLQSFERAGEAAKKLWKALA